MNTLTALATIYLVGAAGMYFAILRSEDTWSTAARMVAVWFWPQMVWMYVMGRIADHRRIRQGAQAIAMLLFVQGIRTADKATAQVIAEAMGTDFTPDNFNAMVCDQLELMTTIGHRHTR